MSRPCAICLSDKRLEIDKKLIAGRPIEELSRSYGFGRDSLRNHKLKHLTKRLTTMTLRKQESEELDIRKEMEGLIVRIKDILTYAEEHRQHNVFLKAAGELRGSFDLLLKIAVALQEAKRDADEQMSEYEQWKKDEEIAQNLMVLTDAELEMLHKLSRKLETQDPKMVILPDTMGKISNVPKWKPKSDTEMQDRAVNAGDAEESALNQVSDSQSIVQPDEQTQTEEPFWRNDDEEEPSHQPKFRRRYA